MRTLSIQATWDDDAKVWVAEGDMASNFTPRLKRLLRDNGCELLRQGKGDLF